MIPFYKAFSLMMRVFSRPLISYTKKYHANNDKQSKIVRLWFIRLGNFYHKVDSKINQKFLKIQSQFAYKPLNEELAIQKGIQFFYELIFYAIVIGLPVYEMYRASEQSSQKSKETDRKLLSIEQKSESILSQLQIMNRQMRKEQDEFQRQISKLKKQRAVQIKWERMLGKGWKFIPCSVGFSKQKSNEYRFYYFQ